MRATRALVIGGSGNFGARICRRLAQEPDVEVIATSRRESYEGDPSRRFVMLDRHAPQFEEALRALRPDVVIHCAGPYQGQDYRVTHASLACGAHYIDLADARDFVADFGACNDARAIAAGRAAISGASTLPALSSAVIDDLARGFSRIDEIDIAIAPAQRSPRGFATICAVLGCAGRPFTWLEDGATRTVYGWQALRRTRFPFGTRIAAACDVPDLALLPTRYPGVRSVRFRAALELPIEHYALACLAGIRRIGIPLPLERLAPWLDRIAVALDRFGSDCGGMSVSVAGCRDSGERRRATWYLVARDNHGPEIPCMAAILLTCRLASGETIGAGARACVGMLTLSEFEREFARWNMSTSVDETHA
ncbi:MAG TPA: NAD-dependent epimerase/dehydratase family protein [Casimicrobiaceae bacterium]|nr:NAD-dependent epimerase/dehydratase family protein [Casimicrobiaceae bacterium]